MTDDPELTVPVRRATAGDGPALPAPEPLPAPESLPAADPPLEVTADPAGDATLVVARRSADAAPGADAAARESSRADSEAMPVVRAGSSTDEAEDVTAVLERRPRPTPPARSGPDTVPTATIADADASTQIAGARVRRTAGAVDVSAPEGRAARPPEVDRRRYRAGEAPGPVVVPRRPAPTQPAGPAADGAAIDARRRRRARRRLIVVIIVGAVVAVAAVAALIALVF